MDTGTIATIVGAVLAAFGAGKGIDIYIGRKRAQPGIEEQPAGTTNPGIVNTGPVAALDIVTESECRATRRELAESIGRQTGDIQTTLKEQTKALGKLTVTVTRIEGKLETATAETDKKLAEHISVHHRKRGTGNLGKTGS